MIPWRSTGSRVHAGSVAFHFIAISTIAAAVLVAYLVPLRNGLTYYSHDTSDMQYVMLRSHVEDLRNHGLVSWCPGLGTGHYRPANPTYGIWSPRTLLFLLVDGYDAQLLSIILYALWAGLGGYVLGFSLTRSRLAALYTGIAWPLSGPVMSQVMNIPYFTSAAWLPWALAAWIGCARAPHRICLTALCAAMIAFEGDLPGAGIFVALLGLLSLLDSAAGSRRTAMACWVATTALVAGLTAVVWLPALAMLPESRRAAGLSVQQATAFSLHPYQLLNLVAPRLWGQLHEGSFWAPWHIPSLAGNLFFQSLYLGLLCPLLVLAALVIRPLRSRRALVFIGIAALLAALSLGRYLPLYPSLIEQIAALRLFRYPAKLYVFACLFLIATAAIALARAERFLEDEACRRRTARAVAILTLVFLAGLVAYVAVSAQAVRAASARPELSFFRIGEDLARLLAFGALVSGLLWFAGKRIRFRRFMMVSILVVAILDILSALPAMSLAPRAALDEPPELASVMRGLGPGRLIISDSLYSSARTTRRDALLPDWGILDGVAYAFGQSASLPARVADLADRDRLAREGAAICRVLGVRYILATAEPEEPWVRALVDQGAIRESSRDQEKNLVLYETIAPNPDVFLARSVGLAPDRDEALALALSAAPGDDLDQATVIAQDAAFVSGSLVSAPPPPPPAPGSLPDVSIGAAPGLIVSTDRPDGDHILIEAELQHPAALVLREYLMSGWRAQVDGTETPLYSADGLGSAIFLAPGHHRVAFSFHPPGLGDGALATAISMVLLLATLTAYRRS